MQGFYHHQQGPVGNALGMLFLGVVTGTQGKRSQLSVCETCAEILRLWRRGCYQVKGGATDWASILRCTRVGVYTCDYMYYVYLYTYVCTTIHMHTRMGKCICIHPCIHTRRLYLHAYMYTSAFLYVCMAGFFLGPPLV